MPAVAVVAVAGLASAAMQASAVQSAASTQARGIRQAAETQRIMSAQARQEILERMVPALADYGKGISDAQQQIADGSANVMQILQTTTAGADQIFQSVGANAKQAILGSTAQAQGIPRQQFNQQYAQSTGTPQTFEQYTASRTGGPELAFDAQGNLGTVADTRQRAMAEVAAGGTGQTFTGQPTTGAISVPGAVSTLADTATTGSTTPNIGTPATTTGALPSGIGFAGAQSQLERGEQLGLANLAQGATQARQDLIIGATEGLGSIRSAREGAIADYQPYTEAGAGAIGQEAALSGALGPEAQQAAIDSFIESPGQKYLREQQEKALLRSGAAIGGLGGGRIRSALMEQAMGIAATQQQQQLENLRSIATRGQSAAGDVAGIRIGTGTTEAGIQTGTAQQLAAIANSLGMNTSQLLSLSSQEMAQLAQSTGLNVAQLEQAIGSARAQGLTGLGSSLAGVVAGGTGDIAGLTERGATTELSGQQNISQILANLAVGAGTNISNLQALEGATLASGQVASANALGQGLQGLGQAAAYGIGNYGTGTNTTSLPQMTDYQKLQLGIY